MQDFTHNALLYLMQNITQNAILEAKTPVFKYKWTLRLDVDPQVLTVPSLYFYCVLSHV